LAFTVPFKVAPEDVILVPVELLPLELALMLEMTNQHLNAKQLQEKVKLFL
jgi:hypothetical protein